MSTKTEQIIHKGKVLAIILRSSARLSGIEFFTPETSPLQMGTHLRDIGEESKPHIHKPIKREIASIQEMLHIDYGKVIIDFYDETGKWITNETLNSGDTILLVEGGHGLKFVEKSKIIEIKQGPYVKNGDKIVFKSSDIKK